MAAKSKYEVGFSSNALKEPRRIVFITNKTSAKVKGETGPKWMTYPHLILREAITLQIVVVALVTVALIWDAPLEQLANPLLTPNPAKAPWYFLGLQELLHYFPPLVAGIVIPALVVVALIVIPYFNINVRGEPLWAHNRRRRFGTLLVILAAVSLILGLFDAWSLLVPTVAVGGLLLYSCFLLPSSRHLPEFLRTRPVSWWVMTWFIVVAVSLTLVGTFFRGPGWIWVWPWRSHGS
jgi:hypothetical protein